jgi:hypothetical protein
LRKNNLIPGTLGIIPLTGFSATNPTVGELSDYIATFTLSSDLYYNSQFSINLPQYVSRLTGTTPVCRILSPIGSSIIIASKYSYFTCSFNSNNQIVISGIF